MFVIIGIILIIIGTILVPIGEQLEHKAKNANKILLPIFAFCFAIGFSSLLSSVIYSNEECITKTYEYRVESSSEIYALKDNVSQQGKFYLGTGSVNNRTYYCYYTITDDGYKYQKISPEGNDVYINYCTENETPHIDTLYKYGITTINDEDYWLVNIKALFNREDYTVGTVIKTNKYPLFQQYKIYVPDGSIIQDYEIDFE